MPEVGWERALLAIARAALIARSSGSKARVVGGDRGAGDGLALDDLPNAIEEPCEARAAGRRVLVCLRLLDVERVEIDVQIDARGADVEGGEDVVEALGVDRPRDRFDFRRLSA